MFLDPLRWKKRTLHRPQSPVTTELSFNTRAGLPTPRRALGSGAVGVAAAQPCRAAVSGGHPLYELRDGAVLIAEG